MRAKIQAWPVAIRLVILLLGQLVFMIAGGVLVHLSDGNKGPWIHAVYWGLTLFGFLWVLEGTFWLLERALAIGARATASAREDQSISARSGALEPSRPTIWSVRVIAWHVFVWSVVLGMLSLVLIEHYVVTPHDRIVSRYVLVALEAGLVGACVGGIVSLYLRPHFWPWLRSRFGNGSVEPSR